MHSSVPWKLFVTLNQRTKGRRRQRQFFQSSIILFNVPQTRRFAALGTRKGDYNRRFVVQFSWKFPHQNVLVCDSISIKVLDRCTSTYSTLMQFLPSVQLFPKHNCLCFCFQNKRQTKLTFCSFFADDCRVPYPSSMRGEVAPSAIHFRSETSTVAGAE